MAKRMTREMADNAAKKLAELAYDKKLEEAKSNEIAFGDVIIKKYIPQPILALMKEYTSWFPYMRDGVECKDENGTKWEKIFIHSTEKVHAYLPCIALSCDDYNKAFKLTKRCISLRNEKENYKQKVSDALMQLKTETRIKNAFPEALPYLNFSDSCALVPKFEDLRKLLKQ